MNISNQIMWRLEVSAFAILCLLLKLQFVYQNNTTQWKPFLYQINRCGKSLRASYIFGILHIPKNLIWPHVPRVVKQALYKADAVMLDNYILEPEDTEYMFLPEDSPSLPDVLGPRLTNLSSHYLKKVAKMLPYWLNISAAEAQVYYYKVLMTNKKILERGRPLALYYFLKMLTYDAFQPTAMQYLPTSGSPLIDEWLRNITRVSQQLKGYSKEEVRKYNIWDTFTIRDELHILELGLAALEVSGGRDFDFFPHHDILTRFSKHIVVHDYTLYRKLKRLLSEESNNVLARKVLNVLQTKTTERYIDYLETKWYKSVYLRKNFDWATRISEFIEANENKSLFVVIGVGHIEGPSNTLTLLRTNFSYDVQPIQTQSHKMSA